MGVRMNNQPQQPKKRLNPYVVGDNVLETVRSIGGNVTKTIGSETLRTIFHPRVLGALFMLIIASLTIRFVSPGFKK